MSTDPSFEWDDFSKKLPNREFSLKVNDKVFWVSREGLAEFSTVFKRLIYGDELNTIQLRAEMELLIQINPDEMLEMLRCLFPTDGKLKKITWANFGVIRKMTDYFDIKFLDNKCVRFIEKMPEIDDSFKNNDQAMFALLFFAIEQRVKPVVRKILPKISRMAFHRVLPYLDHFSEPFQYAIMLVHRHRDHFLIDIGSPGGNGDPKFCIGCRRRLRRYNERCLYCSYAVCDSDECKAKYRHCRNCHSCGNLYMSEDENVEICPCIQDQISTVLDLIDL